MSASPVSQLSQAAGSRAAVPAVSRVILLCVDGVSYDLLMPLVQAKLMPCAGELLSRSALAHVAPTDLLSEMALWSTVHCGAGPETHGRLDDVVFLHQQRQLLATSEQPLDGPSIHRTVAEHLGPPALVWPDGQEGCVRPWRHRPQELADLVRGIQQIDAWLQSIVRQAREAGPSWRLMIARIEALDCLQHVLYHLLGLQSGCTAPRGWAEQIHQLYRCVDRCLGAFLDLADRWGAAVVLASPYAFEPLKGRIDVMELLRRRGLMQAVSLSGQARFIARRALRRVGRSLLRAAGRRSSRGWCRPLTGLQPIDWQRSPVVALHGETEAMIYLNTPQRFGANLACTLRQQEQIAADVTAAMLEARHPVTDEALFARVFLTAERFGIDPLERCWPEIVAVPAPGFLVCQALDYRRQLLRPDLHLSGTHCHKGMMTVWSPSVQLGRSYQAEHIDVAPTVLAMLGLPRPASMCGRALHEPFSSPPPRDCGARPAVRSRPRLRLPA